MKNITTDTKSELKIVVSRPFAGWSGLLFLAFAGYPAWQYYSKQPLPQEQMIGFGIAAATFALVYFLFYEKIFFLFDSTTKTFTWKRSNSITSQGGSLKFDGINEVALQPAIGSSDENPMDRVALFTVSGEIPLTINYEDDYMNLVIAERIKFRLGMPTDDFLTGTLKSLVLRGLADEAKRLLQERKNYTESEAQKFIDNIKAYRI